MTILLLSRSGKIDIAVIYSEAATRGVLKTVLKNC